MIASANLTTTNEGVPERPFESVVGADTGRLYWLALSILDDAGEAEDAVQETLLKAWRSWDSVSQMDQPAAWLTRVCVTHCINRRRLLRSRGWPPLDLTEGAEGHRLAGATMPKASTWIAEASESDHEGSHPQGADRRRHRSHHHRRLHSVWPFDYSGLS